MDIEKTRLDRAVNILDASANKGDDFASCWEEVSGALNGFELSGASEQVRQAVESFGVHCNEVMQGHRAPDAAANQWGVENWDEAEVAQIMESVRELAELIRNDESQRILARLRRHEGVLPKAEIVEARRHSDWFTDLLIEECQSVVAALAQSDGDNDKAKPNSIPFFSLFLFSEWNVARSVPLILQAIRLPGEKPFDLFGDAIHELLPRYLAQFLAGQPERIDELIRSPNANTYVRWCSAGSYKYLVRDEAISLDDAVQRLDRLFEETKVVGEAGRPGLGHDYEVSSGIVETIASLGGGARSKISTNDCDWNFVDESIMPREDFRDSSSIPDRLPPTRVPDCLEELRHWDAFSSKRNPSPSIPTPPRPINRPPSRSLHLPAQSVPPQKSTSVRDSERVPRNTRCPCGSGKKYKQCCLRKT